MNDSPAPPEGTIALLFTDIEGSTRLASTMGAEWPRVLAAHHELVSGAIAAHGGFVDATAGDAFFATFTDAVPAARAAVASLRALRTHAWPPDVGELAVRMGLHVGHVERGPTGYVGLEVHRAARVAAAAHGGQLLLTGAARALIGDVVVSEPLGSHRLKDFPSPEPLFCAVVDGRGAAAFPPPLTEEFRATNLPAGAPSLVGREDGLQQIRRALLVEGERLVTLTGRGGVGKTSLALVAATSLLDEHSGGVWLVRLANVTSPDDVLPAVAAAVGAEGDVTGSPLEAVVARLRGRGLALLLLDNFERLVAAAPAVGGLLDALPDLRMLITSQVPLRLTAERCVPLAALDDEAALALIDRVAVRRGAALSVEEVDRAALLDVVALVDGLPLGLELAAARLALLSPVQLRDRLHDSQDLLKDGGTDRPDRQRSLRATVEWTLGLLEDAQRELFRRMGAFAGAVELEELEAVASGDGLDVLEALAGLLDVALVHRVESGDGRVRFGLPEALRQIAAALLDAAPNGAEWRRAHARRQHDLVWAARTTLVPAGVYSAAVAADAEADAALRWTRANGDPLAASLGASRAMILAGSGRCREALAVLEPLLEQPSGEAEVDTIALTAHGIAMVVVGRGDEGLVSAERAVAIAPDAETRTLAFLTRGLVHTFGGEREAGLRDSEQATAIARGLGPAVLAGALLYETQARIFVGELDGAGERLAEVRRVGTPVDARALWYLETLLGDLEVLSARPHGAFEHYARSLEAAQRRGDELQVLHDLLGIANVLAIVQEDVEALEVVGLAEAQGLEMGGQAGRTVEHLLGDFDLAAAEKRIGAVAAAELKAHGRAAPPGSRVAVACRLARRARPAAVGN